MKEGAILLGVSVRRLRNRIRGLGRHGRLKLFLIVLFSLLFWLGLHTLIFAGLEEGERRLGSESVLFEQVIGALFFLFFLALTIMLAISNGIICYSAFYRARETAFLLSAPVRTESVFLYKFTESMGFSSWAMIFLATPLLVAYGRKFGVHWSYYALSVAFLAAFMWIPAILGAFGAMVLTNFLPNLRRRLVPIAVCGGLILIVWGIAALVELRRRQAAEIRFVTEMFEEIGWTRNPLLPSYWVTQGILKLGGPEPRYGDSLFFFGLIVVNILFGLTLLTSVSGKLLRDGWFTAHGARRARRIRASLLNGLILRGLPVFTPEIRQMLLKDVKSFVRDPVQWSQALIFFGLLGLYFLNLRNLGYDERPDLWKIIVAQMNLGATALTLSVFVSRFVFPQLSMEGRRFWVVGTIPVDRETILLGKFAFSFVCTLLISEGLIGLSSIMLRLPMEMTLTHGVVLVGMCLGLSGMAVGLGAVYPNFREDNPSKIVSGFGGTLNLICNMLFVLACVTLQALPFIAYQMNLPADFPGGGFRTGLLMSIGGVAVLSLFACLVPMQMGLRAIRRLEV